MYIYIYIYLYIYGGCVCVYVCVVCMYYLNITYPPGMLYPKMVTGALKLIHSLLDFMEKLSFF